MKMGAPILAAILACVAASAFAQCAALVWADPARVSAIVDGDTLALEDGREVRLVGLQAPKLALGRRGFAPWPFADEARDALARLALGRTLALGYGGRRTDRYERALAHLRRDDGLWIQGAMLAQGFARVYTFADNRACAAEMLATEGEARTARRGIWAHPFYAVRDAEAAMSGDGFVLVEGRIRRIATVRGRTFLNFGPDWRTDFTAAIARADRRAFADAEPALERLEGMHVRVRGWLRDYNGPFMEITHPEQIEPLARDPH